MNTAAHVPFADLLALIPLGHYTLPAFPFPWSCSAVAVPGGPPTYEGEVVPCLLLEPMYRWALDTDRLLAWANGDDLLLGAQLLQEVRPVVPPGRERIPGPVKLAAALAAGRAVEGRALAKVQSGPAGCREVARSQPWTFLSDTVLGPAERQLGLEREPEWPRCAQRPLDAALTVPAGRGRPRRAPDVDRTLALREEVAWLRYRADERANFATALEALIASAEDRDAWPLHGAPDAPEGQRFRGLLNVVHQRLREHDAVPLLVPLFGQSWARTSAASWRDAPDGGPEAAELHRRVADPRFGGIVRMVAGGTFGTFRFADDGLRSWLEWAREVPG